jgi:hypothetical protein
VTVNWQRLTVYAANNPPTTPEDPTIKALITTYTSDPRTRRCQWEIGWTNVPIAQLRRRLADGLFVNDAIYNDLNTDDKPENDVDILLITRVACARTSHALPTLAV